MHEHASNDYIYSKGFAVYDPDGAAHFRLSSLNEIRQSMNNAEEGKDGNNTSAKRVVPEWDEEAINLKPMSSIGFPSHLSTIQELVDIVTRVIFTGSVLHTAINMPQLEYSSFTPNNPACMRGELPTEKDRGKIDMKRILDSLPDQRLSATQVGVAYTMTNMSGKPLSLTELSPRWMFTDEPFVKQEFDKFVAQLLQIEKGIIERNTSLPIPYTVLMPSKIPCGIGI